MYHQAISVGKGQEQKLVVVVTVVGLILQSRLSPNQINLSNCFLPLSLKQGTRSNQINQK